MVAIIPFPVWGRARVKNIKLGCPLVTTKQLAPTCPPAENRRPDQMPETTTAQTPKAGNECALLCLSSHGHAPAGEKAGGTQVGQQCQGELKRIRGSQSGWDLQGSVGCWGEGCKGEVAEDSVTVLFRHAQSKTLRALARWLWKADAGWWQQLGKGSEEVWLQPSQGDLTGTWSIQLRHREARSWE